MYRDQRGGQVIPRHQVDGLAPQHADAVQLAAVEQHLGEAQIVGRGGDQPHAARGIGARLGKGAGGRCVQQAQLALDSAIQRRKAVQLVRGHPKAGVVHTQRL